MNDEKHAKHVKEIIQAIQKSRPYAEFFQYPVDREIEELVIINQFCDSLQELGALFFDRRSLKHRRRGNDPPDCEAETPDGRVIGIELTELVDGDAIAKNIRGYENYWAKWDKNKLIGAIDKIIDRKGNPTQLKGGPYADYILLIHTDEPVLDFNYVAKLLSGHKFIKNQLINRCFLLISYDPRLRRYPLIELEF